MHHIYVVCMYVALHSKFAIYHGSVFCFFRPVLRVNVGRSNAKKMWLRGGMAISSCLERAVSAIYTASAIARTTYEHISMIHIIMFTAALKKATCYSVMVNNQARAPRSLLTLLGLRVPPRHSEPPPWREK